MITIPIAVHNELFRWQLSLLWYAHRRTYGEHEAAFKVHAVVIRRNEPTTRKARRMEWPMSIRHSMCESFFDLHWRDFRPVEVPLNIQAGLAQVLPSFPDDQVLEVTDCDMLHFRPHPPMDVPEDVLLVSDVYEGWHLHSLGVHRPVIAPYFENGGRFYNGGFVPIIGRAATFRRIMREWIDVHIDIVRRPHPELVKWWAGMFALQAACEKARVQMVAREYCYVPGAFKLADSHYIGHYSVDKTFDKRKFPAVDVSKFPDNPYYALVRDWLGETQPIAQSHAAQPALAEA
jgi:hypothetical protein